MKQYKSYNNYDPHPVNIIEGFNDQAFSGEDDIVNELKRKVKSMQGQHPLILSLDLYPGVNIETVLHIAKKLSADCILNVEDCAKTETQRLREFSEYITDDRVFGVMCYRKISSLYDACVVQNMREKIQKLQNTENENFLIVLYGFGTELFAKADIHVMFELSRWEIQLRYRKGMPNWNCTNCKDPVLRKFKIGYFIEWRLADRYKKQYYETIDYAVDANRDDELHMISGNAFREGLRCIAQRPYRMEPYFDPGVWGGKWMQNVLKVDQDKQNLAWAFDGVPEENAINLRYGTVTLQFPAMDITLYCPRQLLGERVHGRYGAEFPIRFDFLDTIEGGNLSLQVHPLTEYIQNEFGMHYTQDESYYILDTDDEEQRYVYLGLKDNIDRKQMAQDLRKAEKGEIAFPAEKYVNKIPVHKHDHLLIPAGTIHCSGQGCMVLEISATPYIFTFKLWDWGRVGLDGIPRPIHVERGLQNIQWDRNTEYVKRELIHQNKIIDKTGDCLVERTGLHDREPIEVKRYSSTTPFIVDGDDSVIEGNLVDGEEVRIESLNNSFPSLTVHYAETFIIPASVGKCKFVPIKGKISTVCASIRR